MWTHCFSYHFLSRWSLRSLIPWNVNPSTFHKQKLNSTYEIRNTYRKSPNPHFAFLFLRHSAHFGSKFSTNDNDDDDAWFGGPQGDSTITEPPVLSSPTSNQIGAAKLLVLCRGGDDGVEWGNLLDLFTTRAAYLLFVRTRVTTIRQLFAFTTL